MRGQGIALDAASILVGETRADFFERDDPIVIGVDLGEVFGTRVFFTGELAVVVLVGAGEYFSKLLGVWGAAGAVFGDLFQFTARFRIVSVLPNPLGWHHLVAPFVEGVCQLSEFFGVGIGEIVRFTGIGIEIEELWVFAGLLDHLPFAGAEALLSIGAPDEFFMRRRLFFAGEEGDEVDAIEGWGVSIVEGEDRKSVV